MSNIITQLLLSNTHSPPKLFSLTGHTYSYTGSEQDLQHRRFVKWKTTYRHELNKVGQPCSLHVYSIDYIKGAYHDAICFLYDTITTKIRTNFTYRDENYKMSVKNIFVSTWRIFRRMIPMWGSLETLLSLIDLGRSLVQCRWRYCCSMSWFLTSPIGGCTSEATKRVSAWRGKTARHWATQALSVSIIHLFSGVIKLFIKKKNSQS